MKTLFTFMRGHGQVMFLLSLIITYSLFDFQAKLFQPPQGYHFIRQTDCLSFVANYYNNGFDFFSPQLFTLNNSNGKAVCEFPVLYYITALLCLIVYEPVFILKLLTLTIVSAGFLYLFKLLQKLFQSSFYAGVFSLLFLSSTILLYYSVNVLPDPAALGFTLIGWYHVFNFRNKRFARAWGFGFFTLASLLKVTFFIYPLAAFLYLLFICKREGNPIRRVLEYFLLSAALVLIWNLFVSDYNSENHAGSFLLTALPVWNMTAEEIREVTDHAFNYWHSEYYYQTTQHLFFILLMLSIGFVCRMEKGLLVLLGLLILAGGSFIVLFFPQFKDHDYYFITILPALILMVSISFVTLQKIMPAVHSWLFKGVFLTICVLSLNYAHKKLDEREQRPADKFASTALKLIDADKKLDSLNIPKDAKIIVYPDYTPNGGLFLAKRMGWGVSALEEVRAHEAKASLILLTEKDSIAQFNGYKIIGEFSKFILLESMAGL